MHATTAGLCGPRARLRPGREELPGLTGAHPRRVAFAAVGSRPVSTERRLRSRSLRTSLAGLAGSTAEGARPSGQARVRRRRTRSTVGTEPYLKRALGGWRRRALHLDLQARRAGSERAAAQGPGADQSSQASGPTTTRTPSAASTILCGRRCALPAKRRCIVWPNIVRPPVGGSELRRLQQRAATARRSPLQPPGRQLDRHGRSATGTGSPTTESTSTPAATPREPERSPAPPATAAARWPNRDKSDKPKTKAGHANALGDRSQS